MNSCGVVAAVQAVEAVRDKAVIVVRCASSCGILLYAHTYAVCD
jgi:hypothetical protein